VALQGAQLLPERGHQLNEGVKLGVAPLLALVGEVLERFAQGFFGGVVPDHDLDLFEVVFHGFSIGEA
jgi:hypothetical protein